MKPVVFIFFLFHITILLHQPVRAYDEKIKEVAVVIGKFDPIEKILNKYQIEYKKCTFSDLGKNEFYNQFRTIFFPCGVENPIETNVSILSRGTTIHSVSLKKDFPEVNEELIYKNIKSFIENGGNAYFSDYSFKLLDGAFKVMKFYDNFPNLGLSGHIDLELKNDLFFFNRGRIFKAEMIHPGWVVVKSMQYSEVLAVSKLNTIREMLSSPVIMVLKRGLGDAIYTSYHKTSGDDEISRYIIYRLIYKHIAEKVTDKASAWEQEINCTLIDSVREWENYRSYIIPVKKGKNTLYFFSEKGNYQADIYDSENELIISTDPHCPEFHINIKSQSDQNLTAKIYPSTPRRYGVYSIVSGSGIRIIPYYKKILLGLFLILIIVAINFINKTIGVKKFSGRITVK